MLWKFPVSFGAVASFEEEWEGTWIYPEAGDYDFRGSRPCKLPFTACGLKLEPDVWDCSQDSTNDLKTLSSKR